MSAEANFGPRCDTCYLYMPFEFCLQCQIKRVTCVKCHVPFTSLKKFQNHLKEHLTDSKIPSQCWIEARRIKIPYHLYVCPKCVNFLCKDISEFVKHQRTMHIVTREEYNCDVCQKRFVTKIGLRLHIRTHTYQPQFVCKVCGKEFYWLSKLKLHAKTHSTRSNFECKYCEKRFKTVFTLRRHVSQHTFSKPYSCESCDLSFRFHFALKRHQLTHVDSRPIFKCEDCEKTYNWKSDLRRHIYRHHLRTNLHTCTVCEKKFSRKCYLVQHKALHGEAKAYLCFCGRTFRYQSNLTRHRRLKHDNLLKNEVVL